MQRNNFVRENGINNTTVYRKSSCRASNAHNSIPVVCEVENEECYNSNIPTINKHVNGESNNNNNKKKDNQSSSESNEVVPNMSFNSITEQSETQHLSVYHELEYDIPIMIGWSPKAKFETTTHYTRNNYSCKNNNSNKGTSTTHGEKEKRRKISYVYSMVSWGNISPTTSVNMNYSFKSETSHDAQNKSISNNENKENEQFNCEEHLEESEVCLPEELQWERQHEDCNMNANDNNYEYCKDSVNDKMSASEEASNQNNNNNYSNSNNNNNNNNNNNSNSNLHSSRRSFRFSNSESDEVAEMHNVIAMTSKFMELLTFPPLLSNEVQTELISEKDALPHATSKCNESNTLLLSSSSSSSSITPSITPEESNQRQNMNKEVQEQELFNKTTSSSQWLQQSISILSIPSLLNSNSKLASHFEESNRSRMSSFAIRNSSSHLLNAGEDDKVSFTDSHNDDACNNNINNKYYTVKDEPVSPKEWNKDISRVELTDSNVGSQFAMQNSNNNSNIRADKNIKHRKEEKEPQLQTLLKEVKEFKSKQENDTNHLIFDNTVNVDENNGDGAKNWSVQTMPQFRHYLTQEVDHTTKHNKLKVINIAANYNNITSNCHNSHNESTKNVTDNSNKNNNIYESKHVISNNESESINNNEAMNSSLEFVKEHNGIRSDRQAEPTSREASISFTSLSALLPTHDKKATTSKVIIERSKERNKHSSSQMPHYESNYLAPLTLQTTKTLVKSQKQAKMLSNSKNDNSIFSHSHNDTTFPTVEQGMKRRVEVGLDDKTHEQRELFHQQQQQKTVKHTNTQIHKAREHSNKDVLPLTSKLTVENLNRYTQEQFRQQEELWKRHCDITEQEWLNVHEINNNNNNNSNRNSSSSNNLDSKNYNILKINNSSSRLSEVSNSNPSRSRSRNSVSTSRNTSHMSTSEIDNVSVARLKRKALLATEQRAQDKFARHNNSTSLQLSTLEVPSLSAVEMSSSALSSLTLSKNNSPTAQPKTPSSSKNLIKRIWHRCLTSITENKTSNSQSTAEKCHDKLRKNYNNNNENTSNMKLGKCMSLNDNIHHVRKWELSVDENKESTSAPTIAQLKRRSITEIENDTSISNSFINTKVINNNNKDVHYAKNTNETKIVSVMNTLGKSAPIFEQQSLDDKRHVTPPVLNAMYGVSRYQEQSTNELSNSNSMTRKNDVTFLPRIRNTFENITNAVNNNKSHNNNNNNNKSNNKEIISSRTNENIKNHNLVRSNKIKEHNNINEKELLSRHVTNKKKVQRENSRESSSVANPETSMRNYQVVLPTNFVSAKIKKNAKESEKRSPRRKKDTNHDYHHQCSCSNKDNVFHSYNTSEKNELQKEEVLIEPTFEQSSSILFTRSSESPNCSRRIANKEIINTKTKTKTTTTRRRTKTQHITTKDTLVKCANEQPDINKDNIHVSDSNGNDDDDDNSNINNNISKSSSSYGISNTLSKRYYQHESNGSNDGDNNSSNNVNYREVADNNRNGTNNLLPVKMLDNANNNNTINEKSVRDLRELILLSSRASSKERENIIHERLGSSSGQSTNSQSSWSRRRRERRKTSFKPFHPFKITAEKFEQLQNVKMKSMPESDLDKRRGKKREQL